MGIFSICFQIHIIQRKRESLRDEKKTEKETKPSEMHAQMYNASNEQKTNK